MDTWRIRQLLPADLEEVSAIYAAARRYMADHGNPTQWGTHWPDQAQIQEDIRLERLYGLEESGQLCGCFVFAPGVEPTYEVITDGAWEGNGPYATIHRLASNGRCRGIFTRCVAFCKPLTGELRVDTHADNHTMQHVIAQQGFQRRGIIHVEDGTPRIAYQLIC